MGELSTIALKGLAKGFFAMTAGVLLFSIIALIRGGDAWLGLLYFLILLMPLSSAAYLWQRKKKAEGEVASSSKLSTFLLSLQGVALACWVYDLATTYYAIDVARVATELNPLGWPLGALGALSYYVPTVILTYVLLFRIKQKISLYAAVPMTAVTLWMGSMNLNAGIGNFGFFIATAALPAGLRGDLLALVVAVDLLYVMVFVRFSSRLFLSTPRKLNSIEKR